VEEVTILAPNEDRNQIPVPSSELPVTILNDLRVKSNFIHLNVVWGHAVAQWLRHCAKNRKVAGSIPDGVIGIFQ
jgi:hypothetical protein